MSIIQFPQNNNEGKSPFDIIRRLDENGNEFWTGRDLMPLLDYSKWDNFKKVIEKAIIACKNSKINIDCNFSRPQEATLKIAKEGKSIYCLMVKLSCGIIAAAMRRILIADVLTILV